uniref:Cellulose 1,4-beta-cellobiosidase n=1 Tax=Pseudomonas phage RVTF4 TaxID=3236931 RepID=A0AB39CD15_9VIRU
MATVSTTGLYPEDLHGNNPLNLIPDEIQTLQVPGKDDYYFIIPHAAPFFVDSLEVYNAQTGERYIENDDYLVGHWFIEAMDSIGRPIAGSIRFMKRTIAGQVRLKYRTIGGVWGFSETQVLAELNRKLLNPLTRSWGMIGELPYSFPPLEHDQSIDSLVGSVEIEAALRHLADVVEASAAGASEQHLKDYNNPHRVTKTQVLLGLVQNFGMATAPEAIAGVRADAYVSPATMKAAIDAQALTPLNAHIRATGNVHGMVAADINLGNVPNYPAANASQAIDVTNSTTLMTPYTTALMFQKLMNTARVDELENKLNQHINDTTSNPHKITPEMIGTYTKERIDQLIAAAGGGGGGDAATFGGKTPAEWASEFISVPEFDKFISDEQFGGSVAAAKNAIADPDNAPPPQTPEEEQLYELSLITGASAGYEVYVVNTSRWAGRMVASSDVPMDPSAGQPAYSEYMAESQYAWVSLKDARYSISARNGILASGSAALTIPAAYSEKSASVTKPVDWVWASKTEVFAHMKDTKELRRFKAGGVDEVIVQYTPWSVGVAGREPTAVYAATQLNDPQSLVIVEVEVSTGTDPDNLTRTFDFLVFGDATWQSTTNAVINTIKATDDIQSIAIGDKQVLFMTASKGCFLANIDRTNPNAVKLVLDNSATVFYGDQTLSLRAANLTDNTPNGEGVSVISGNYSHFALATNKGNVWFIGDNSEGQCEVKVNQRAVIGIAAGYKFTVTVNSLHQPQFFGDSPDNSLLYAHRGIVVKP